MKHKIKIILLLLLILVFSNNRVSAAEDSSDDNYICVSGFMYDVVDKAGQTLDTVTEYYEMLDYIEKNNVDLTAKDSDAYKAFIKIYKDVYEKYGADKTKSPFSITALNRSCIITYNGEIRSWNSCPTLDQTNGIYSQENLEKAISVVQFNKETGKFYMNIEDKFNSTVLVRVVRAGDTANESGSNYSKIFADEVYNLNSSGITITFNKSEDYRLEFYLRNGVTCAGSFIGSFDATAPGFAYVGNPHPEAKYCQDFIEGYKNIPEQPINYKEILVPECYKSELEYWTEYLTITESFVKEKIADVVNEYKNINSVAGETSLQCNYDASQNKTEEEKRESYTNTISYFYNPGGYKFWYAYCTETVTVTYDQPKKVIAGSGFSYDTNLTVTRSCSPRVLKQASIVIPCEYDIECWGGPHNHTGQGGAGPNEDFDSCVNTCDGGKYTKDCIEKCYEKVYEGKDVDITSKDDVLGFQSTSFLDVAKATQVAAIPVASSSCTSQDILDCKCKTPTSPNYCYTRNNWKTSSGTTKSGAVIYQYVTNNVNLGNCDKWSTCTSFHGLGFIYKIACNGTKCYEVYKSPARPLCSDNPSADGSGELTKANAEYKSLLEDIKEYEESEEVTMSIVDSYKLGNNGSKLTTSNDTESDMVKVTGGRIKYSNGEDFSVTKEKAKLVTYATDGRTKWVPSIEVKKEYKFELPRAVIDKLNKQEKYVKTSYNRLLSEYEGGNKYYTDINSGTYNDYRPYSNGTERWYHLYNPTKNTDDNEKKYVGNNISVIFRDVGTSLESTRWSFGDIKLECFYGIVNNRVLNCDGDVCEEYCGENDICTGGLQYYFRPINLYNMFPDRDPRWNWTDGAKIPNDINYPYAPSEIIDEIEKKGEQVYSETPSYEINLTSGNISSIRKANAKLDYQTYFEGIQCYENNGKEVCKSNIDSYVSSIIRNTELGTND